MELQAYLDSVRHTPFQWGEHDCALFAAKWWDRKLGTSIAERVRAFGIRSSRDYRRLQRDGKSLESLIVEVIGPPVTGEPVRGDVVLVRSTKGASLGISVPPLILCAGERGIEPVPVACAELIWRLPCHK